MRALRAAGLGLSLALLTAVASAQVGPSPIEAAAYKDLHAAAWSGDAKAVGKAHAVALNARDGHGRTAVHVATFARRLAVIRALAQAGANLNALENDRYDAVTIAAVADDETTLALLLELGASARQITSRYDGTALIAAAHLGHDGVVRQLIRAGAPLDHVNNLHWTALIEAVVLGDGGPRHQRVVRDLLEAGADPTLTDRDGRTARDLARSRGYGEMAKQLEAACSRRAATAGATRCRGD